jgi:hypothetical protein
MVKLNISDLLIKTSLAYILDRTGVPERIKEIRKAWKIENLIPSNKFQEWLDSYHADLTMTKEASDYYSNNVDKFEIEDSRDSSITVDKLARVVKLSKFNVIDFEIELLMKKFGINSKYKNIIIKAVICNEINDGDLSKVKDLADYDLLLDSQELRFVIEKHYLGQEKSEVDRDRRWFYKSKQYMKAGKSFRKSFQKIAKDDGEEEDKVRLQLKRYKSFLKG